MDSLVAGFFKMFNGAYEEVLQLDFNTMSLQQQIGLFKRLFKVYSYMYSISTYMYNACKCIIHVCVPVCKIILINNTL